MSAQLVPGTMIKIGSRYATLCSYNAAVDKTAKILEGYEQNNPYRLQGRHLIYYVRECSPDGTIVGRTWEIHAADAIPIVNATNQSLKGLLDKEW